MVSNFNTYSKMKIYVKSLDLEKSYNNLTKRLLVIIIKILDILL